MPDEPTNQSDQNQSPPPEEKLGEKKEVSTATNYLSELVKSGKLKREGQRGGTKYSA